MPFAVILGEEEVGRGEVRVKEMGLGEGHGEKDGVVVGMGELVGEVRGRLERKRREVGGDGGGEVVNDSMKELKVEDRGEKTGDDGV